MGLYQIVNQKSQNLKCKAEVVKLVDTHVSEACGASCAGSSPAFGTFIRWARQLSARKNSTLKVQDWQR